MKLIKDTNIDFIGQIRLGFMISGFMILAGLISLGLQGGPKLSIDFTGGTIIAVNFTQDMDINEVRTSMGQVPFQGAVYDFSKSEIKHFGSLKSISARLPILEDSPVDFAQGVVDYLYNTFPGKVPAERTDFLLSIEKVGPKIGAELGGAAIKAILFAMLLILAYISIRFEFKFAVGAIVALFHDVLITLGIFSIMDLPISLSVIAAFLTIVGYSLNDTIVIFDRIRENLKAQKRDPYNAVINQSINQSLSRTIITSLTTFFVVFILWLFGGEVIHNFAFAMIIGVVVGTYSSVYIASPILILLHKAQAGK